MLVTSGFQEADLVNDGWTDVSRKPRRPADCARNQNSEISPQEIMRLAEMADFKKMNQIRARVDAIVKDKRTAEALKPWYRQFCKRPTFNDEYLPTFNRSNVTLVDTRGRGVDRITEKGLVFDEVEYDVGLHYLRHRFRGGHGLHPAGGLRDLRSRRKVTD